MRGMVSWETAAIWTNELVAFPKPHIPVYRHLMAWDGHKNNSLTVSGTVVSARSARYRNLLFDYWSENLLYNRQSRSNEKAGIHFLTQTKNRVWERG